ncbi:Cu(I)-responsive transcriptional regulator [Parathalassolituus penaei]|uniref:Cu(I)-responsive transcriptional regulator n=1 Tax=Parathalassolituus penaei TaxID=2997323 RepID=A0A9X3ISS6_9GAMM|nr:Cu(I)-responsive transcriptional regulator [Parathalassolituus penaei]MCY0966727.1 Cu(I)-responsive transcriptional regulator [Parathalassolituus penaei]
MNIGAASEASGISAKMIRYYESIGLITPAGRSASGYRRYSERDVHTLRFIRRARDLGFSMEQVADLLALWGDSGRQSQDVKALAQQHIDGLQQRIGELQSMVNTLNHLVSCCAGDQRPDCPILEDMAGLGRSCCEAGEGD